VIARQHRLFLRWLPEKPAGFTSHFALPARPALLRQAFAVRLWRYHRFSRYLDRA